MITLTKVLVPTNLGDPSKAAVTYGVALARQFKAQLFLLRVLATRDYDAVLEGERVVEALAHGAAAAALTTEAVLEQAARQTLGGLLSPEDERDTRAVYLLRAAGPAGPSGEIVATAQQHGIQLIVMGKHRLGIVEHLLAGSVTEKVMRHAPCPVLIVQHPQQEFVLPDGPGGSGEPT
jgi:nucleotide-binding universal stress UspA family protein